MELEAIHRSRPTDLRQGRPLISRWAVALSALFLVGGAAPPPKPPPTPAATFGRLYADVELAGVFADSKTFADAVPRRPPAAILADYGQQPSGDDLRIFVSRNFDLPNTVATPPPIAGQPLTLKAHIAALWPALARPPLTAAAYSSQISLAYPYVIPGGRFREIYYWDSYFTMLGLVRDGRGDLAQALTSNFADLIARYGHVPNGARTYYLSRSQPPVFYLMAGLASGPSPTAGYVRYLPALRREYAFWMRGEDRARPGRPAEHVVRLPNGAVLNRYWDALAVPRDEAYRADVELARASGRPAPEVYRDLRAAAESGWDFSSRWLADGRSLGAIETTAIIPIDLNSLLYGLEEAIERGCGQVRDLACVREFRARAARRRSAIDRYLWDSTSGQYLDYDWRRGARLDRPSAAMLYPLFTGLADQRQAAAVSRHVEKELLAPGGLRTTLTRTGQQWDAPNGWAPLQWIAVLGLNRYGQSRTASVVATRWLTTVCRTYRETGKLLEKYDVEEARPGGGGEYPLQDGFGWTNGVSRALLDSYKPAGEGNCASPAVPSPPTQAIVGR